MEGLKEIADRVFATPGRAKGGACGQTIEAMSRSTFHRISAWDADYLYEAAAELARLRAALDAAERRAQDAILDALAAQGQAAEAHEARVKAEAERDAARAKALEEACMKINCVLDNLYERLPDTPERTCATIVLHQAQSTIRAMKEPKP